MPSLSLFSIETIIYDSSYKSNEFSRYLLIFRRWLDVSGEVSNTKGLHEISFLCIYPDQSTACGPAECRARLY